KALFWIVKHGLKYTAMPAWPAQQRDDEVWAVTAFLVRLPELSPRAYRELAGMTRTGQAVQDGAELATGSESVGLTECVRCHGDAGVAGTAAGRRGVGGHGIPGAPPRAVAAGVPRARRDDAHRAGGAGRRRARDGERIRGPDGVRALPRRCGDGAAVRLRSRAQ